MARARASGGGGQGGREGGEAREGAAGGEGPPGPGEGGAGEEPACGQGRGRGGRQEVRQPGAWQVCRKLVVVCILPEIRQRGLWLEGNRVNPRYLVCVFVYYWRRPRQPSDKVKRRKVCVCVFYTSSIDLAYWLTNEKTLVSVRLKTENAKPRCVCVALLPATALRDEMTAAGSLGEKTTETTPASPPGFTDMGGGTRRRTNRWFQPRAFEPWHACREHDTRYTTTKPFSSPAISTPRAVCARVLCVLVCCLRWCASTTLMRLTKQETVVCVGGSSCEYPRGHARVFTHGNTPVSARECFFNVMLRGAVCF